MPSKQKSGLRAAAMAYLNQWHETDRQHMDAVAAAGANDSALAVALLAVAAEYRVSRAFGWAGRVGNRLASIEVVAGLARAFEAEAETFNDMVWDLARTIGERFPRKNGAKSIQLSAATKVLWFAGHRNVRIFDDLAFKGLLGKKRYGSIQPSQWEAFMTAWEAQYEIERPGIEAVIGELRNDVNGALDWSLASEDRIAAVDVMAQPWFAERVFDKYLWIKGGQWASRGKAVSLDVMS